MDKYSKSFIMIFKIPIGIFYILAGIALIGVSVWVSTFSDVASMIFLISLLGGGFAINYGVGYAFLGDKYRATNIVRDGNTVFEVVETPKLLKRRKVVTLIGFISYILLAVYYIIRIILVCNYMAYLQHINYNTSIVALIIFSIIALIIAFAFFMIYKKTKHIDLNEKQD